MTTAAERLLAGVSRETRDRLAILAAAIRRWQPAVNLVAPSTLADLETRHITDCLQLTAIPAPAGTWVDLGSGAGLPGLVIAACDPTRIVHLVESDQRKCAFLRRTARGMGVAAEIHEGRSEHVIETIAERPGGIAVVTARALAPLTRLLGYSQPLLERGAVGIFPKGRGLADELTLAHESWRFVSDIVPSMTGPDGGIIRITGFHGRRSKPDDATRTTC